MGRIALAQMTSTADFDANLACAEKLVSEAAAKGAELLAFPEVFLYIGPDAGRFRGAEPIEGGIVGRFRRAAASHGLWILLGSVHERIPGDSNRVYNTSVLIDGNGEVVATYRKRKLFDIDIPGTCIKESDAFRPGGEPSPIVGTPLGEAGVAICFDLRFPELFLDLRRRGAEIVFVPANFTAPTGAAHWEVLLRARAIENQVFVAAPAQYGPNRPGYESFGHSMVVDPWGRVLAVASAGTGLILAEIDLEVLREVRRGLPMGREEQRPRHP